MMMMGASVIEYIETAKEIVALIAALLSLLSMALLFLSKWFKNAKLKKIAENLNRVSTAVDDFVEKAETFANYSGKEKKEYVKSQIKNFAYDNGINYDDQLVDDLIERAVKFSRNVNFKKSEGDDAEPEEGSGS